MSESKSNPYQSPVVLEPGDSLASATGTDGINPEQREILGQLTKVALGLKLIYWGILLLLLAWIGVVPIAMFWMFATGPVAGGQFISLAYLATYALAIGLINVGPLYCLSVPSVYGLRGFVIGTLILLMLAWSTILTALFISGDGGEIFGIALLVLLALASFLVFLYRLSRVIAREDLVRRCRNVFVIGAIVLGLGVARYLFSRFIPSNAVIFELWTWGAFVAAIVLFIAYANVVNGIANAIRYPGLKRTKLQIL